MTGGVGADSVLECVGTQESMIQAIRCARPGGTIGYVGVPHGVDLDGQSLFFSQTGMHGGPAPVRRFLPQLIELVLSRKINPGKVFDLNCRSPTSPRDTAPWTSAGRSRRCCACNISRRELARLWSRHAARAATVTIIPKT